MTSRKRAGNSWQTESGDIADSRGGSGDTMINRRARCFVYASCVFVCALECCVCNVRVYVVMCGCADIECMCTCSCVCGCLVRVHGGVVHV